jgi:hypothetical protein
MLADAGESGGVAFLSYGATRGPTIKAACAVS